MPTKVAPSEEAAHGVGGLKQLLDGLLNQGTITRERYDQALAALADEQHDDAVIHGDFEFGDEAPVARKLRGMWVRHWPRRAEQAAVREMQQKTGCRDPFMCLRFLHGYEQQARVQWRRFLSPSSRTVRGLDVGAASTLLSQYLAWRKGHLASLFVDPGPIVNELLGGWATVLPGTSHRGDVVLYVRAKLLNAHRERMQPDVDLCWRALAYQLERAFARNPNPMAQVLVLYDRTENSHGNLDIHLIKHFTKQWLKSYPLRWRGCLVYPVGTSGASRLRAFAVAALGSVIPPRVVFADTLDTILREVPREVVPVHMGGNCLYEPDLIDALLPQATKPATSADRSAAESLWANRRWLAQAVKLEMQGSGDEAATEDGSAVQSASGFVFGNERKTLRYDQWRSRHTSVPAAGLLFLAAFAMCDTTLDAFATQAGASSDMRSHVRPATWGALGILAALSACCHRYRFLQHLLMGLLSSCFRFYLDAHAAKRGQSGASIASPDEAHFGGDHTLQTARQAFAAVVLSHLLVFNLPPFRFFAACSTLWVVWFVVHCSVAGKLVVPMAAQWQGIGFVLFTAVICWAREQTRLQRWKSACDCDDTVVAQAREVAYMTLNGSTTPAFECDGELFVTNWPLSMEQLTGISPSQILGLNLVDHAISPATRSTTKQAFDDALSSDSLRIQGMELELLSRLTTGEAAEPDHSVKWVKFSMRIVRVAGVVTTVSAAGQDVTESKRLERARNSFLASFSHELRTPLTGILGMLELLSKLDLPDSKASTVARKYVTKATTSSNLLLCLVNDILDMSRIEAGQITIAEAEFDLHKAIESTIDMVRESANFKKLEIKVVIDKMAPKLVLSDVTRFRQVLMNLLSNAIKFTPKGFVRVILANEIPFVASESTAASQTTSEKQIMVRLHVEDTGIGIKQSDQKKLLLGTMFTKLEDGNAVNVYGCGLGLSICKRLIGLMGGEIHLRSQKGKGSTFEMCFKARKPGPAKEKGSKQASQEEAAAQQQKLLSKEKGVARLRGMRVLLAEDTPFNGEIMMHNLQTAGMVAEWAKDGVQAVAFFKRACAEKKPFNIVLMDCLMPNMSGTQASSAIRDFEAGNALSRTPIVAITGYNPSDDFNAEVKQAGMDGKLLKPFSCDQLLNTVVSYTTKKVSPEFQEISALSPSTSMMVLSPTTHLRSLRDRRTAPANLHGRFQFDADGLAADTGIQSGSKSKTVRKQSSLIPAAVQSRAALALASVTSISTSPSSSNRRANPHSTPAQVASTRSQKQSMSTSRAAAPATSQITAAFGDMPFEPGNAAEFQPLVRMFASDPDRMPQLMHRLKVAFDAKNAADLQMAAGCLVSATLYLHADLQMAAGRVVSALQGNDTSFSEFRLRMMSRYMGQLEDEVGRTTAKIMANTISGPGELTAADMDAKWQTSLPLPSGRTVVLGESDLFTRDMIGTMLRSIISSLGRSIPPLELVWANDEDEVVKKVLEARLQPLLVIMDVAILSQSGGGVGGIDACKNIRRWELMEDKASVSIVGISTSAQKEVCIAGGMDGFMRKPVKQAELRRLLVDTLSLNTDAAADGVDDV